MASLSVCDTPFLGFLLKYSITLLAIGSEEDEARKARWFASMLLSCSRDKTEGEFSRYNSAQSHFQLHIHCGDRAFVSGLFVVRV